jgi:hypothetical protein
MRFAVLVIACVISLQAGSARARRIELPVEPKPLPAGATLYMFDRSPGELASRETMVEDVGIAVDGAHVYAVTVLADSGLVTVDGTTYRLGIPLPARTATVAGVMLDRFCRRITLDVTGNASAYRIDWHDGGPSVWLRPRDLTFGGRCSEPRLDAREPRAFDLYAVFADRSELLVGSSAIQISDDTVRLPAELIASRITPEPITITDDEFLPADPRPAVPPSTWLAYALVWLVLLAPRALGNGGSSRT